MVRRVWLVRQLFLFVFVTLLLPLFHPKSSYAVGNLRSVTSTLSTYSLGATAVEATFTLTTGSSLPVGKYIQINFPSFVPIDPATATLSLISSNPDVPGLSIVTVGDNPNTNSYVSSGNAFFKTSGASIPAGTVLTIKVTGIVNGGSTVTGNFYIKTTSDSSGTVIDGDSSNVNANYAFSSMTHVGTIAFQGTVTNSGGTAVPNTYVNIYPASMLGGGAMPQGGQTDSAGKYIITTTNVDIGSTYFLEVFPPFNGGGNLLPPDRYSTAYVGSPITKNFQFTVATKTITGTVVYTGTSTPVTNAQVNAFKMSGSGYAQATTNGSGIYTLTVGGGDWGVMPQATQGVSDWAYGQPPTTAKFVSDSSVESKTIDFSVYRASSIITGRLLKPNGSPVTQSDNLGIGVFSQEGKGGGGQINNDNGTFSITVPAGTYNINVWASPSSSFGSPTVTPVTVADGQTVSVGDITLTTKDSTITGIVRTSSGVGVSGVRVNAFVRDGGGFSEATSGNDGTFSLSVTAGRWMVMPSFGYDASYSTNTPPQEVSVTASSPATVNFEVQSSTATISGVVQDSNGVPISTYGYAFAETGGGEMFGPGGLGGPIERGNFSFKVPAGSYTINAGLAPGSGYTSGAGTTVTIADSETKTIAITLATNDATITGSILNSSGSALSSSGLSVFAMSKGGGHGSYQQGTVSGSTYTISVSAGEWTLGYFVDPSTGYMSAPPDPSNKFTVTSGGTVTKNITLTSANATITGKVTKPDGTDAVGAFISVDNRETEGKSFFNGAPTNSSGNYTLKIAAGTYKVRVNVPPGQGYLSPAEQTVTVAADGTETANFTLRSSDASITGNVTLNSSPLASFVSAWSDDGGFTQSMSNSSGNYTLSVTKNTTWHVRARYENGTTPYESAESSVVMSSDSATANLALASVSYTLPQSLTTTFDSTQPKIITLSDDTEINIPASALATSGNVTLTVNPKASLPSKKGDKPLWYGYEFSATDSSGNAITSFNSTITITFPYTDTQLTAQGITAADLVPSYWDDTTGTWKKVSNITVDTTNKTVTITTDHFTDYALTANIAATSTTSTTTTSSSNNNNSTPGCNNQPPASAPKIFEIRRSKDTVKLHFVPASGSVNYYYISYSDKPNQDKYGVSFDQGYSGGALTYIIKALNPRTKYYFRIRAGNGCMPGPWSPWVSTAGAKPYVIASAAIKSPKTTRTKPVKLDTSPAVESIQPASPPAVKPSQAPAIAPPKPVVKPAPQSIFDKIKAFFGI